MRFELKILFHVAHQRLFSASGSIASFLAQSPTQILTVVRQLLGKDFNEKRVLAKGMSVIGKVKEIEVNPDTFAVTDLIVQVEKEAARKIFGERFLFGGADIKVPVSTIDKLGDVVSLKFDVSQLKDYVVKI